MERQVGMARGSAGDPHERLCPLLRDIARDRLATAGIDLDRDPEAAALAVGPGDVGARARRPAAAR